MESGKSSEIKSIDLDRSDNLSEAVIKKFIDQHHDKLEGLVVWEASVARDQVGCKQVKQRPGDVSKQVSAICRTTSSVVDCPPLGLQEE